MQINLDDFRRHFELLSDDSLLAVNRQELVGAAQGVYDEELERRGLAAPVDVEEAAEPMPDRVSTGADDELVLVASYNIPDEASLARGLLQSAEIPFLLQNDMVALGGIELRLMVPKQYEEEALEILNHELTDEELAAQAEAAGYAEENEEFEGEEEFSEEHEPEA